MDEKLHNIFGNAQLITFFTKKKCNITAPLINQTGLVKGVDIL